MGDEYSLGFFFPLYGNMYGKYNLVLKNLYNENFKLNMMSKSEFVWHSEIFTKMLLYEG